MYLRHNRLAPLLCLALNLCLPAQAMAEDFSSIATTTIGGANNILGAGNQFMGAVGAGGNDINNLVQQMTKMQQQTSGDQTQQSQFDKIKTDLTSALTTAKSCVDKNTRTYDKYYAKHKEAANVSADRLKSAEATCKNYGTILDAISTNNARLKDVNAKMTCLTDLQNSVNQIAEKAKAPFQQLTTAAQEVYKTHTAIIDAHKQIAEKIGKEVDGENGYRARLGKLKQLSFDLTNVLNGKKGEAKDGMKTGLVKAVEDLKGMRTNAANEWYFTMMQDVESCFHSQPAPCFDNDVSLPPSECIGAMLENESIGVSAGKHARGETDKRGLQDIRLATYMKSQKVNLPANLDLADSTQFLKFTRSRFDETLSGVLSTYRSHNFNLKINNSKLASFVNQNYNTCYNNAVANFHADMDSKGGRYYAKFNAMKDAERETGADITNWINRVEGEMTEFRTSFHKVYNSDLAQFGTDCTTGNDPYQGIDCLRVFQATLDSGIKGTRKSTQLSNGTNYSVSAGETQLTVQTLTLGPDGKPTVGSAPVGCSGFDDCINYMDRQKAQHEGAQAKQETDRKNFVEQHNSAVKASFAIVGAQFSTMSQLILSGVNGVNDDLAKLGVGASMKTKDVEAEALVENKDTGMIDMPKSMKGALASQGAYTTIEDTKDVTAAYNDLAKELSTKANEARKAKRECKVEDSEYKALEGVMPKDCKPSQVCKHDSLARASGNIENIFRKSKEKFDPNSAKLSANSDYRTCVSDIKSDAKDIDNGDLDSWAKENGYPKGIFQGAEDKRTLNEEQKGKVMKAYKAKVDKGVKGDIRSDCNEYILTALGSQAAEGRNSFFQEKNGSIVNSLRDVNAACSDDPMDEDSVRDACESFKKLVKGVSVPRDEDETNVKEVAGGTQRLENPLNSTVVPAK